MKSIKLLWSLLVSTFIIECFVKSDSCEFHPFCVDKLHVRVFYDHNSNKADSTQSLISNVCNNYKKFNDKMNVSFHLIAKISPVGDTGAECQDGEDCEDELRQACAESLSQKPVEFRCCISSFDDCVSEFQIDTNELDKCADDDDNTNSDGAKALRVNFDKFNAAGFENHGKLPAVVYNDGTYDECTDKASYNDFLGTVCELFTPDPKLRPPCYTIEF